MSSRQACVCLVFYTTTTACTTACNFPYTMPHFSACFLPIPAATSCLSTYTMLTCPPLPSACCLSHWPLLSLPACLHCHLLHPTKPIAGDAATPAVLCSIQRKTHVAREDCFAATTIVFSPVVNVNNIVPRRRTDIFVMRVLAGVSYVAFQRWPAAHFGFSNLAMRRICCRCAMGSSLVEGNCFNRNCWRDGSPFHFPVCAGIITHQPIYIFHGRSGVYQNCRLC